MSQQATLNWGVLTQSLLNMMAEEKRFFSSEKKGMIDFDMANSNLNGCPRLEMVCEGNGRDYRENHDIRDYAAAGGAEPVPFRPVFNQQLCVLRD